MIAARPVPAVSLVKPAVKSVVKPVAKPAVKQETEGAMLAVIRIKTSPMISIKVEDTLDFLRLHKKFYCVLWKSSPQILGMINKVQSYITWGEIDAETLKLLKEKREEKGRTFFRMHPPRGGFERKGIKMPFKNGGVYGNRKEKINLLIKRML
jgi:large subunit ribosomal protein L30